MQIAKFELEDGRIAKFEVPDNITSEQAFNLVSSQLNELNNPKKQEVAAPATAAIPERTYGEVAKDVGAAVATGLGGLGQFPGQLYGLATGDFSDTGLYGKAKELEKYGESLKSPGLVAREKASQARVAEAEKESQVSAFFTAIKEIITDPVQLPNFLISQSLQSIPSIAAALVPLVGPAASAEIKALQIAAKTATSVAAKEIAEKQLKDYVADVAIKTGTRQAIGTGAVQQGADIGTGAYEDIYKKLIDQKVPEDQAAERALGLARAAGASGAVISLLSQNLPGARVLEERLAGMRFGSPGGVGGNLASRVAGGVGVGLKEGLTEIPEEVGGKFSQNLAMQQVDPTQALTEGLGATGGQAFIGGFGLGTVIGSLTHGDSARIAEEKRSIEQAKLQTQKEQALNQQNLTKTQLGITEEQQQLALPAPDELFKQTSNPLFNPFGNYSSADLGINPEVDAYVKQHRQLTGKPNIESYSIEDIQDAMPGTNTAGEKAAIDSFLTAKTGYTPEVTYTAQDIQNVATQKNIETKTKGFNDFLTRTTGINNVAEMSQPQLHAAFTALSNLPKSPDLQILPQGTNATRFTEDQYKKSIESLKAVGNNLSREDALNKIYDQIKVPYAEPVNPIAVNKAPDVEAEQRNKTYFENLQRKNAESILSKALRQNDLETVKVPKFDVIAPDGSVTVSPLTRESAERIAAKTEGFTVKESSAEKIAVVDQSVLPKGFDIQQQSFKQEGVPAGYQIKAGNVLISPTAFTTEEEATNKVKSYEGIRAKQIESINQQLTKLEAEKTKGQNELDAMEVSGSSSTPAYRVASAAFDNQVRGIDTKVVGLNKQKELLAVPLQIIPTGSAIRSGFTVFEQGIPKATLPTKQAAEEHIIANASDETLQNISTSPTPNRLRNKANEEINRRAGKVEPGIKVAKSPEIKEQANVENQAQMKKLEEILKPILAKFGLNTTKLKIVKEVDGGKGEASYSGIENLINLAFDAVNPVRALRHESVHALKELGFFTDGQWKALVNQANTKWINKYLKQKNVSGNPLAAGEQSRYEAYMKAYDGNQEAIIEEAIADAFADFDINGASAGFMAALLTKIQNFFKALLNALNGAGFQTAEDVFGKVERGELRGTKEAGAAEKKSLVTEVAKAKAYEEKNDIAPYLSVGEQYLPTTGGEKYSLKTKDKYGMYEGIPLNNDGTITVYYHTTKANAMDINKAKRISPSDDKRVYLTNESSGALVLKNKRLLPQETDGSVVMLKLPPEMMQFVDKYPDGRVDMFIPLAEGDFFNQKMRVSAIQVSKNKAILDKGQTFSYKDHAARMSGALTAYEGMSAEGKKQAIKRAAEVLREQHNIGTLLTTNGKLEKTSPEAEGLSDLDVNASSMGLGMAAAQKITDKLSSCPNSAICADLCLGDTAGGNQQYGGVAKEDVNGIEKSAFRAGPRMVQYLKTEALVIHPEEFVLVLSNEIQKFKDYERSTTIKQKNPETGKRETVEAEVYEPSIRLNVTSDFAPEMFKPLLDAHPDVVFYDYTKLQGKPVSDNHHLTYSSTGFAQMVDGKLVQHKSNNWNAMRGKLDSGYNVAMAFTSKSVLPKTVLDEETGNTYQVWDGDNYDARYLDPKRPDGIGMIVGLRNKAGTMKERESAAQTDGFFANYDPKVDGNKVVVPDQKVLTGRKVIPIAKEKLSLRETVAVDKNGKPLQLYHSTYSAFDKPKINYGTDEWKQFGFHVGSLEAAQNRLGIKAAEDKREGVKNGNAGANIIPVYLDIRNPLRLDENRTGRWGVDDIMSTIMDTADKNGDISRTSASLSSLDVDMFMSDEFPIEAWLAGETDPESPNFNPNSSSKNWSDDSDFAPGEKSKLLIDFIKTLGYDSIVYENKFEGGGDSYIALDAKQVKSQFRPEGKFSLRAAPNTPEFKRWFGNSKVVDKNGEPMVMYHGTARDITEFRPKQANAIFLTKNPKFANDFSSLSKDYLHQEFWENSSLDEKIEILVKVLETPKLRMEQVLNPVEYKTLKKDITDASLGFGPGIVKSLDNIMPFALRIGVLDEINLKLPTNENIMPVYVSAQNPFDYENSNHVQQVVDELNKTFNSTNYGQNIGDKEKNYIARGNWVTIENQFTQKAIRNLGFDGFYVEEGKQKNIAVYKSSQIKSAIGNTGAYDATNPDIRYSLRKFKSEDLPKEQRKYNLPANTLIFHGSHGSAAAKIEESGRVLLTYPGIKSSGGTTEEGGLIFFGSADTADNFAQSLADPFAVESARDRGEIRSAGTVFQTVTDRSYKLMDRYQKLTAAEANALNEALGIPDYKYLRKGDSANRAASLADSTSRFTSEKVKRTIIKRGEYDQVMSSPWPVIFKTLEVDGFYDNRNVPSIALTSDNGIRLVGKDNRLEKFSLTQKVNSLPNSSKILDSVNKIISVQEQTGHVERMVAAFSPKSRSNFRAAFIDRYNQIGVNSKQVAKLMGENWLLADVSAEAAANMSDLATGVSASALGVGQGKGGIPVYANGFTKVFNDDGKIKGAVEIFSTLAKYNNPEIYRLYQWWAGSLRGKRLLDEGREYSYTRDDIKLAEELLVSFPEFEQVQKEWIVYNDGLVKYAVDTGVLTEKAGEEFSKYGDYIPFYRQIDGEQTVGPNIFSGISGVKGPKTLKGNEKSEAPLADFLETIVRNTQSIIESGMKNVAAERAIRDAVILGQAEKLNFQPKEFKSDVVSYQEKGRTVYYKLADPALYEAMKGLNLPDLPWLGILSAPANLLRTLVTKDPGFMLVNLMRDSVSAWVTSGSNMTPIVDTMNQFVKTLAGKSPEAEALMMSGVLGGYDFASNVESGGKDLAKYLRKKTNTKTTTEFLATPFTSIWEALEKGTTASDAATRAAIYRKVMDETGNEAEAIYKALEVLNFNRKGNAAVVRILTAVVPFLNARIQGLDVLYRASFGEMASKDAKAIQKAFIIRGLFLMGMTALYYAATSDDDEYKKQEQEVRDNNWLIPSLGIKIPIPFEIGILFKVIPERIMAYHYGTDTGKDLLDSAARNIMSTLAFNPVPQAIIPFVETATNHSFFTGREIVPRELQDVSPEFQTNAQTSGLAKRISSGLTNILPNGLKEKVLSPIQIDHIVNGYTGTLGMYASNMLNSVFDKSTDPTRADLRLEQMPVLRRILMDKEAKGNVTAYYDLKHSTDTMVRTINLLEKTQNFEELGKYQQENLNLLATQDYMKDLAKMMKELNEYSVMIKSSQMDGASKRDALLAINQAQNNVTANIKTIRKMLN